MLDKKSLSFGRDCPSVAVALFIAVHRRTNYVQVMEPFKKFYPIDEFGAIYTPNVYVFKQSEQHDYKLLDSPQTLSFIAAAAYAAPKLSKDPNGNLVMSSEKTEGTKKKIRTILSVGEIHKHDAIVLSSFGCGAFKNPPQQMAQLFKEVIEADGFCAAFKKITFAILDNYNSFKAHNKEGNFYAFQQVFGCNNSQQQNTNKKSKKKT